jgi:hypothetical protein
MPNVAPYPSDPAILAVVMAYHNESLIADLVLPRLRVLKQEYRWYEWSKAESYTIPDTSVGRRSAPNEVEFGATEKAGVTKNHGLRDPIPQDDIDNAPTGVDVLGRAAEGLADMIRLDRERRVANMVFSASAYATSNKTILAGTSQFSDPVNSKPISVITTGLGIPLVRPNVIVMGQAVWDALRQHPEIVSAVLGNAGTKGLVSREQFAMLFELTEVLVGSGFVNTAKPGQTATYGRLWGKHMLLFRRDPLADPTRNANRPTYGFTAESGEPVARSEANSSIGLRGGVVVTVGESVDEQIAAPDLAYFIENAVA